MYNILKHRCQHYSFGDITHPTETSKCSTKRNARQPRQILSASPTQCFLDSFASAAWTKDKGADSRSPLVAGLARGLRPRDSSTGKTKPGQRGGGRGGLELGPRPRAPATCLSMRAGPRPAVGEPRFWALPHAPAAPVPAPATPVPSHLRPLDAMTHDRFADVAAAQGPEGADADRRGSSCGGGGGEGGGRGQPETEALP